MRISHVELIEFVFKDYYILISEIYESLILQMIIKWQNFEKCHLITIFYF